MAKSLMMTVSVLTAGFAAFAADCDVLVVGGGARGIAHASCSVGRDCSDEMSKGPGD